VFDVADVYRNGEASQAWANQIAPVMPRSGVFLFARILFAGNGVAEVFHQFLTFSGDDRIREKQRQCGDKAFAMIADPPNC
jgi:hypothetical protein